MASVLEAVAEGDITPSEGTAIAGIIEHHRRAIEPPKSRNGYEHWKIRNHDQCDIETTA
jgi:hypothetical protein